MNRKSTAALMLATVFLAGVAGTLGVLRIAEHQGDRRGDYFDRTGPPGSRFDRPWGDRSRPDRSGEGHEVRERSELVRLRVTDRLVRALDLTEEQVAGIRAAMERQQADAQEVWDDVLPVLAAQRDSLNAELQRILTPEQYARFERYLSDDRERGLRSWDRESRRRR